MSKMLEPRRVSIRDIPCWLRESWALFTRRTACFMGISVAYYLLAMSARSLPGLGLLLGILLCQVGAVLMIRLAMAADHSDALAFKPTWGMIRNVLWCLLLLTVVYLVLYVSVLLLTLTFLSPEVLPGNDYAGTALFAAFRWVLPGELAFLILYTGIVVTSLWFLTPLLALHELTLRDAMRLARRAEGRNEGVILAASYLPFLPFVLLFMYSDLSLPLSLLYVPLFAIYQYVSYRHVFLGRRDNKPARARVRAAAPVPVLQSK
ncbi:MAG TPA: hypothetical protein ENK48_04570 [Gammaproteobacteria bacterium]|nr:hypothetical protein [Gammaproteobacteria bacterium]